ncbi:MAG: oligosaccharide repeat unit polymerase [Butyrivibrio sp.]|nr:oligosaccharide repeat unit polymerase [Butyrivibrio sp.]
MVYLLLAGIALLLFLSFKFIDRDFISPVNLYLLFSALAVAGMFLCYVEWKVDEYGFKASAVYLVGSLCFAFGCYLAKRISSKPVKVKEKPELNEDMSDEADGREVKRIEIGYVKIAIMSAVTLAALVGTWIWLIKLEEGSSDYTIAQAINYRRTMDIQGKLVGEYAKGRIWMLLTEFSGAFASIAIFVFVRNAVNRKLVKRDILLWIPIMVCILEFLSLSNRSGIFVMAFTAIISWFVSMKVKCRWKETLNKKVIKTAAIALAVFIPVFFGSLFIVGRHLSLKHFGYKEYTAIYVSGGVRCLDWYMKEPTDPPKRFGEETLVALHANLYSRFGIGENTTRYLEWRNLDDEPVANTYTSFRRFYHDFGIAGVVILTLLQGLIISVLYYKIQRRSERDKISFVEVMYCYLAHTTVYIAIDDLFYSSWASLYGIKMTMIMFAAYFLMFCIMRKETGGIAIDWKRIGVKNAKD